MKNQFLKESSAFGWFTFFLIFLIVALGAFVQNTNFLSFGGVKPNISLALLTAFAVFFGSFTQYLLLTVLTAILLRFEPGFEITTFAFILAAAAIYFTLRRLSGQPLINIFLVLAFYTFIFYAFSNFGFLRESFGTVLREMAYNSFIGAALFICVRRFFKGEYI